MYKVNDTLSFGFSGSNCVMNFDEFRISRGVRDSSEMMKRKSGMVLIIR